MKRLALSALLPALAGLAAPAQAEIWYLHTRSNNIQCEMGDDPTTASMMCSLTRRSGPLARPKPADCAEAWGYSYFLAERGEARMLCLQKWTQNWPGNDKFTVGPAGKDGGINCAATRNTLECTNRDGHGFFLSRREQRVF